MRRGPKIKEEPILSISSSSYLTRDSPMSTSPLRSTRLFQAEDDPHPCHAVKQMQVGYHRCNAHISGCELKPPITRPHWAKGKYRPLKKRCTHPFGLIHGVTDPLVDLQQLQIKDKLRIARYPRDSLFAVCEICWDDDTALAACLHTCNTDIPAFDN